MAYCPLLRGARLNRRDFIGLSAARLAGCSESPLPRHRAHCSAQTGKPATGCATHPARHRRRHPGYRLAGGHCWRWHCRPVGSPAASQSRTARFRAAGAGSTAGWQQPLWRKPDHGRYPWAPTICRCRGRKPCGYASCWPIWGYCRATLPPCGRTNDDRYLCHAPQERLFIHGQWQEGLWPQFGIGRAEQAQYRRFEALMEQFRQLRGRTGDRRLPFRRRSVRTIRRCGRWTG